MRSSVKVTIGLPVYNGDDYLVDAIESLLNQTYRNFELIIADNGSTDGTEQICTSYAATDQRIHYMRSEENRGATWNYNRLVPLAQGQYFRWAAHDDLCESTHLEACVDVLENNPDVVLAFPQTVLIDADGEPIEFYPNRLNLIAPQPHVRLRQLLRGPGLCSPVFGLIRLDVLKRTTLIESYADSDRVLLAQLALRGRFLEVQQPLFLRRMHPKTSVASNLDFKSRLAWFDPQRRARLTFPKWRRFGGYTSAIAGSELNLSERLHCYSELGQRYFLHPKWMLTDLLDGVRSTAIGSEWKQTNDTPSHV